LKIIGVDMPISTKHYTKDQNDLVENLLKDNERANADVLFYSKAIVDQLNERNIEIVKMGNLGGDALNPCIDFLVQPCDPDCASHKDHYIYIQNQLITLRGSALRRYEFSHYQGVTDYSKEKVLQEVKSIIDFGESINFLRRSDKPITKFGTDQIILHETFFANDLQRNVYVMDDFMGRIRKFLELRMGKELHLVVDRNFFIDSAWGNFSFVLVPDPDLHVLDQEWSVELQMRGPVCLSRFSLRSKSFSSISTKLFLPTWAEKYEDEEMDAQWGQKKYEGDMDICMYSAENLLKNITK